MSSKGRPYREILVEGFSVLVGRGDAENDYLTFRVASPADLWFHVGGGTPGSHVVVQRGTATEIPASVIAHAASFAAWYSKARGAAKVEVHFCRASEVSKPRGAPRGQVQLRRFSRTKVVPAPPPLTSAG